MRQYKKFSILISYTKEDRFGYAILKKGAYRSFGNNRTFKNESEALKAAKDEINSKPDWLEDNQIESIDGGAK